MEVGDLVAELAAAGMIAVGADMAVAVPAVPESVVAVLQLFLVEADIASLGPTVDRQ
jgi:hypothetical protein